MQSPAQLDNHQRAHKDEDMDATIDTLRRETSSQIDTLNKETSSRIAELRRQALEQSRLVDAKIENVRQQMLDHFNAADAKIGNSRQQMLDAKRETTLRIDTLMYESNRRMARRDEQFGWLACLLIANLLGIAALLVKAM